MNIEKINNIKNNENIIISKEIVTDIKTVDNNKYNCEKCNFICNTKARWNAHINTQLHITGQRKKRSDYKEPLRCDRCEYKTKNRMILEQHILNEHSTLDERKNKFKYYCKTCDYGSISKDSYQRHTKTKKHLLKENRNK